ncbi:MAG: DUF805 domain-containing protein [Bacteroidales bacterium]|nr:DUF805 domain-containing protein [Bacteroidales bacterium]
MYWYLKVLKQYADFKGRARRNEYWMFVLINMIISVIAIILDNVLGIEIEITGYGPIFGLYLLAVIIPSIAVVVRRLHDTGKSGWMILIALIPLIGTIWLLILLFTASNPEENEYGTNPKDIQRDDTMAEDLILIYIVWSFLSRIFWIILPRINDDFFHSLTYEVSQKYMTLIWVIIPLSFAFAVKNKPKQIIVFILAGLLLIESLYNVTMYFMK